MYYFVFRGSLFRAQKTPGPPSFSSWSGTSIVLNIAIVLACRDLDKDGLVWFTVCPTYPTRASLPFSRTELFLPNLRENAAFLGFFTSSGVKDLCTLMSQNTSVTPSETATPEGLFLEVRGHLLLETITTPGGRPEYHTLGGQVAALSLPQLSFQFLSLSDWIPPGSAAVSCKCTQYLPRAGGR